MPAKKLIIPGTRFARLTAVCEAKERSKGGNYIWECRCECGTVVHVLSTCLFSGRSKSCGCLSRDLLIERSTRHGAAARGGRTPAYQAWKAMRSRCHSPTNQDYKEYGGRGIVVCEEWRNSFEAFLRDMGEPSTGLSLDRFPDNNGNYEPGNCRWTTSKNQGRNKRNNRLITFNGITAPLSEWAETTGLTITTIYTRFRKGYSVEKILSQKNLWSPSIPLKQTKPTSTP